MVRQLVLGERSEGRHLQPVAAHAAAGALGCLRPARRVRASKRLLLRRRESETRGLRTSSSSTTTRPWRVLFSTDAGGVGLNLQRAASSVINLELPWNPAVLEQRVGRIYRLGQKQPIQVYNLVSEGGIEARIAKHRQRQAGTLHGPLRRHQQRAEIHWIRAVSGQDGTTGGGRTSARRRRTRGGHRRGHGARTRRGAVRGLPTCRRGAGAPQTQPIRRSSSY